MVHPSCSLLALGVARALAVPNRLADIAAVSFGRHRSRRRLEARLGDRYFSRAIAQLSRESLTPTQISVWFWLE